MPIYFSSFITALLFGKWWCEQSQPTAKWAPFILRVIGLFSTVVRSSECGSAFRFGKSDSCAVLVEIKAPEMRVSPQELNADLNFSGRDSALPHDQASSASVPAWPMSVLPGCIHSRNAPILAPEELMSRGGSAWRGESLGHRTRKNRLPRGTEESRPIQPGRHLRRIRAAPCSRLHTSRPGGHRSNFQA